MKHNNTYKKSMTICIAAICDNNQKIVVASDRMITASHLSQQFEHGVPKMEEISKSCLAVTAGSALAPREIFSSVRTWASSKSNTSISEIVEEVKNRFNKLRIRKAEEKYIKSRGFESVEDFYSKSQSLPPQIVVPINEKLENEELGVEVLIAGVDSDGAHVYWVTDPGVSNCYDSLCYSAVGSGEPHALHTFIAESYDGSVSLKKALFVVFEAKRNAENAPGVGSKSDFWIIDKNGLSKVDDSILIELEKIYKKKKAKLDESNREVVGDIDKLEVEKYEKK